MKLYVANTKKQNEEFLFRVLGSEKLIRRSIPAGGQIFVGDFQSEEIDYIIRQHEPYGMVESKRIKAQRHFVGLCHSIGEPVSLDHMTLAFHLNDEILKEKGKEMRETAAVVIDDSLQKMNLNASETSIVITEETKNGDLPTINEGVKVSRSKK